MQPPPSPNILVLTLTTDNLPFPHIATAHIDIDECSGVTCGGDSKCKNGHNKFACNCAEGWTGGGDNRVCSRTRAKAGPDGDDCAGVKCGGLSQCVDGVNKFTRNCAPGWRGGGDNTVCTG